MSPRPPDPDQSAAPHTDARQQDSGFFSELMVWVLVIIVGTILGTILGFAFMGSSELLADAFQLDRSVAAILITVGLLIYFFPSFVAQQRKHRYLAQIFIINLFFGLSLIGWVGALLWAFWPEKNENVAPSPTGSEGNSTVTAATEPQTLKPSERWGNRYERGEPISSNAVPSGGERTPVAPSKVFDEVHSEPLEVDRYTKGDITYVMFSDGAMEVRSASGVERYASLEEFRAQAKDQGGPAEPPREDGKPAAPPAEPAQSSINRLESLERLAKLRDVGALTDAEFKAAKKRILGGSP